MKISILFKQFLAKTLATETSILDFIFQPKSLFFRKNLWLVPYIIWTSILYQVSPLFLKTSLDIFENKQTKLSFFGREIFNFGSIFYLIAIVLLAELFLNIVSQIYEYLQNKKLEKIEWEIEASLEDRFNQFLSRFDNSFLSAENNLRIISGMQWDIRSIEKDTSEVFKKFISLPVSLFSLIFILPLINGYLMMFVVFISIFNITMESVQSQNWRKFEILTDRLQNQKDHLYSWIIHKFGRVAIDGWFTELWQIYVSRRSALWGSAFIRNESNRKIYFLKNNVNAIGTTVLYLVSFYLLTTGDITLGSFIVFPLYLGRVKSIFDNFGSITQSLVTLRFKYTKLSFILNLKPKLNYENQIQQPIESIESIKFDNVSFTYPNFFDTEKDYLNKLKGKLKLETQISQKNQLNFVQKQLKKIADAYLGLSETKSLKKSLKELEEIMGQGKTQKVILDKLNISFEKGKIYAIVGYNGAGKSTLVKLLKRGFDPSAGKIIVNNEFDLKNLEVEKWKREINSVDQQSLIWPSLSIRENLQLGSDKELIDEQIWQALDGLGIKNKIDNLDQIIHENINLSGGQEQLLEIARVYLQQKPLLILDEGTNQLDAEKESRVIKMLHKIKTESIVVIISHRMTTAAKCDHIYVLDEGEIKASGSHEQLLKGDNLYKQFWEMQVVK